MRWAVGLLLCLGLAWPSPAAAGARFEGLAAYKTAADTTWDMAHEKVWSNVLYGYAAASASWGFDYAGFVSAAFEYRLEHGEETDGEFIPELRELYGKFRIGPFDLFVGQQITSWAVADMLSLHDQLNPYDYRRVLDQEVSLSRLGTPMIRPVVYLGPVQLEAAFMPLFTTPRYSVVGGDFAAVGHEFPVDIVLNALRQDEGWRRFERSMVFYLPEWSDEIHDMLSDPEYWETRTEIPDQDITAPEVAARLRYTSPAIDLQATYFYLWDDIPTLHLNPHLRDLENLLVRDENGLREPPDLSQDTLRALKDPAALVHHRTPSAGLGLSTRVWDISFQAEGLYEWRRHTYRNDLWSVTRDQASWLANVEYTFEYDILVKGMLLERYIVDREDDFWERGWTHILGVALRKPFLDEKLMLEALAIWDLTELNGKNWRSGDWFAAGWSVNPMLTWSATDRLKVSASANLIGGNDDTLVGFREGESRVGLSARYGF